MLKENKENKKILNILIVVTRGVVGGAQKSVFELASALRRDGHKVVVGYGDGDFLKEECDKDNILTKKFKHLSRSHNVFSIFLFIFEIRKFINKNNFDVVHLNSSNALLAVFAIKSLKKEKRPKIVFTFRGLSFLDEKSYGSKIVKYFYRLVFKFLTKFVDENVFVSRSNYDFAIRKQIVSAGTVIYNGINFKKNVFINKELAREEISKKIKKNLDGYFIIGSIGRLSYAKNYEFLINQMPFIIKNFPNTKTIIIGGGNEEKKYKRLINNLNLNNHVFLFGELKNASRYIKAFDLFVLPSRYEGFSVTVIESLCAGIPLLISNVGGAKEQLDHSLEQLYDLDNEIDFRIKFSKLIANIQKLNYLSDLNFKKSFYYDIEETKNNYIKIFNN
ncbi:MAG TPA: glycosyltransferase [Candidatus Paceibacterota bacterium]|nr:glycosyltransferase [Candidatus Paceibacterota bacterium]